MESLKRISFKVIVFKNNWSSEIEYKKISGYYYGKIGNGYFAIHRSTVNKDYWTITELITGVKAVYGFRTRKDALEYLKNDFLKEHSVEEINKSIDYSIKEYGITNLEFI